jgi:hypothetical protein
VFDSKCHRKEREREREKEGREEGREGEQTKEIPANFQAQSPTPAQATGIHTGPVLLPALLLGLQP